MTTARVFANGRSQAVRLPKECRFDCDEVVVRQIDGMVLLFPAAKGWDLMADSLGKFTKDYMATRRQPRQQKRRRL